MEEQISPKGASNESRAAIKEVAGGVLTLKKRLQSEPWQGGDDSDSQLQSEAIANATLALAISSLTQLAALPLHTVRQPTANSPNWKCQPSGNCHAALADRHKRILAEASS